MKYYRAKPSAQLPNSKDMYILHCCYKLVDNHLEIVPVCKLKAVKAMGITLQGVVTAIYPVLPAATAISF